MKCKLLLIFLMPIIVFAQQDTLRFQEGHVAIGKAHDESIKTIYVNSIIYGKDSLIYWNNVLNISPKPLPPIRTIPSMDGNNVYLDTVVKVDSTTSNKLYNQAKLWIADNFKNSKAVIDLDNKEDGTIIGKANQELYLTNSLDIPVQTRCSFTLKIRVKDNKYRLEVYDLSYRPDKGTYINGYYSAPVTTYPKDWFLPTMTKGFPVIKQSYKDETLKMLNSIFISLQIAMSSKNKDDDW